MVYPPQGTSQLGEGATDPRLSGVLNIQLSAPTVVSPTTLQDLSLSIYTVEGRPIVANLVAGTITITRARAGVDTVIVNAEACTTATGRIFYAYTFPAASWQVGDEYKAVFSEQRVVVDVTTCSLSDIRCKGAVVSFAAIVALFAVPGADAVTNVNMRDVIGNKTDTANAVVDAVSSLMRYIKGLLGLHTVPGADVVTNVNARDVVGNKTDTANATVGDTSSLMRYIKGLLGLHPVPGADVVTNVNSRDVIGNKTDTANVTIGATSSLMRYIKGILGISNRVINGPLPFWSAFQEEIQVPAIAATLNLPDVVVAGIPAGATIVRAIAVILVGRIENVNAAANALDGATVAATSQVFQVRDNAPGTWTDCINLVDDLFGADAGISIIGGLPMLGMVDVSAEVDGNGTYNFRWLLAKCDADFLNFNDVQVGLMITHS